MIPHWLSASLLMVASAVVGIRGVEIAERVTQRPPERVVWSIVIAPKSYVVAGRTFNAILSAKIETGWHLYALSQPAGGPIAMSVTVPKEQPFSLGGKVLEPTPTRRVDPNHSQLGESFTFDDLATFTVPLRVAAGTKAGEHVVRVEVEFQVCTDTVCLRPTTVELRLPVTVR